VRPQWEGPEFKSISLISPVSLPSLLAIFIKPLSRVCISYLRRSFVFSFALPLSYCLIFRLGSSDRLAIAKAERNVGKGARTARIQRSKTVFVTVSLFLLSLVRFVFVFRVAD